MDANDIKQYSSDIFSDMIKIRRWFHQNPELSFQEYETSAFIKEYLQNLHIQCRENVAITGIEALIPINGGKGKTIALRADMDALPVTEQNKTDYVSQKKGVMHACGHDMHMTLLLGVASVLSKMKLPFSGNVKLIFQPGEEGYAGAKKMVDEGVLQNPQVDAILAAHVAPWLQKGKISVCRGPAMASPSEFKIVIKGKGGHAAQPHKCINPISICLNMR